MVQDNLSSHWTTEVRTVARQLGITLVTTSPTYASWINGIEFQFGMMVKAVFAGSDYRDHAEIQAAVATYDRTHGIGAVNIPDRAKSDLERRLGEHCQSRWPQLIDAGSTAVISTPTSRPPRLTAMTSHCSAFG